MTLLGVRILCFEDPFGPVLPDDVVAGHGGQLGFLMLKNYIGGPHEASTTMVEGPVCILKNLFRI